MKKTLNFIIGMAFLLCIASCGKPVEEEDLWATAVYTEDTAFGNGEKELSLEVIAGEKSVVFTVNSDSETVGEALAEHKLVSGEKSPYGIYIKTVNGILADYDINQSYWSFTKAGEYMTTGVDATEFSDGDKFELTYTK